jgi:hypothetical protein
LASFGESSPARVSTLFGTQHIITGQWVRLGKTDSGAISPAFSTHPPEITNGFL